MGEQAHLEMSADCLMMLKKTCIAHVYLGKLPHGASKAETTTVPDSTAIYIIKYQYVLYCNTTAWIVSKRWLCLVSVRNHLLRPLSLAREPPSTVPYFMADTQIWNILFFLLCALYASVANTEARHSGGSDTGSTPSERDQWFAVFAEADKGMMAPEVNERSSLRMVRISRCRYCRGNLLTPWPLLVHAHLGDKNAWI